jgi:hypothetical protein
MVKKPGSRPFLGHALRQPAFIVAAVLLFVAAAGLNAATDAMKLHFKKEAVPLSVPRLDDGRVGIPAKLGTWVQISKDEGLQHSTQEVLGTKEFIFRDYVNSALVSESDIAWFKDKSSEERGRKLQEIENNHPDAIVRLAITYYTGLVDTVPHVPEKCYVADGFEAANGTDTRTPTLHCGDGADRTITYRYVRFQDMTQTGRKDREVAYLFHVNGHYESSSIGVRSELQNLLQRYGYFAKVELMTQSPNSLSATEDMKSASQQRSTAAINDMLAALLPELERCLPDWKKVTGGKN